jgi:predicted metal-dependent peptidase
MTTIIITDSERYRRLDEAQIRVLFSCPFFASGVCKLPVRFVSGIETACTNGEVILWDRDFFDATDDTSLPTVYCHEVAHCQLGHLWRIPEGADWELWNIATDHAINLMLKEFSDLLKSQGKADPFPFPTGMEFCMNPKYTGMSEEQIYWVLNAEKRSGSRFKASDKSGGSQGSGQSGKILPGASQRAKSPAGIGQIEAPSQDPANSGKQKALQADWEGTLIQSAKIAAAQGQLPASIKRLVDGLVNPKLPWRQILASWLREQVSDDWNWLQPAIEYDESGFILPSLRSDRIRAIVTVIDTSGSVDEKLLAEFKTEEQSALDTLKPERLIEICCDAKVQSYREYQPGDQVDLDAPGGGGTDFRPAIERALEIEPKPRCMVYLTDGHGTFGEDPGVPVIWIMYGGKKDAPYGLVLPV